MLRTTDSLAGYAISATDGELGKVMDLYFDDERWGIRYLIVETGSWLSSRQVLISPYSVTEIDDEDETIQVSLTRDEVKNSPDIDTHTPVSRRLESQYALYYGYDDYWMGPYLWGLGAYPVRLPDQDGSTAPISEDDEEAAGLGQDNPADVHLRSSKETSGHHILGTDDDIGHVKDFLFDDKDWAIRYLLVDTHNWWPGGQKVLLATQWIEQINWSDASVQTALTREQIKNSPQYSEDIPIDRDYETRLHSFYGRKGYWD